MTRPCANECPESVAVLHKDMGITIEEWEANMHFHEGCRVGHVGAACTLKPMEGRPMSKEVVDVPAPEKRSRGRKPKQEHLPGQEPQPKIAAVHSAIEAYVEVRDERMRLTELEVQKRTLLGEVMKKHGLTSYAVDGHIAEIESEEKVKARLKTEEEAEAEEA